MILEFVLGPESCSCSLEVECEVECEVACAVGWLPGFAASSHEGVFDLLWASWKSYRFEETCSVEVNCVQKCKF